jgi:hypothetical protein
LQSSKRYQPAQQKKVYHLLAASTGTAIPEAAYH